MRRTRAQPSVVLSLALSLALAVTLLGALSGLAGCFRMETESKMERGSVLRTFQRERLLTDSSLHVSGDIRWPRSELHVTFARDCVVEDVEEYADRRTTTYEAPSAGPTVAAGASNFVIGGVLWLTRNLFSSTPGMSGQPSTREGVTIASYVLMSVGLPAAIVGIVGLTEDGTKTEVVKTEEVVHTHTDSCEPAPISGVLTLLLPDTTQTVELDVKDGAVVLDAERLRGRTFNGLLFNDEPVDLSPRIQADLDALVACLEVLPPPDEETLAQAGPKRRALWQDAARMCNQLPGTPAGRPDRYAPRPDAAGAR